MRTKLTSIALTGLLLASALAAVSISALGDGDLFDDDRTDEEIPTWTMMVYIAGDNNLEFQAVYDLNEMELYGSTEYVNIVALVDTHGITNGTHLFYVEEGETCIDLNTGETDCDCEEILGTPCDDEELNTGDPATLQKFIEDSVTYAPADRYMLVIWDHGGGWYGACWDDSSIRPIDNRTDRLTIDEIGGAIRAAEENTGTHLDILGFDACLMSMLEVAYEYVDLADYMVASVTGIPFDGWAYDLFLDDLTTTPSMSVEELLDCIVEGYVEYYSFCAGSGLGGWTGVTLSVVDLTQMGALATAVDALSYELGEGLASGDIARGSLISAFQANTPSLQMSGQQFAFPDLGLFAESLGEMYPSLSGVTDPIVSVIEDAVYCDWVSQEYGGAFTTMGLTIYLPCSYYYTYVDYSYETAEEAAEFEEYIYYGMDFVIDTNWDEFILEDFCVA